MKTLFLEYCEAMRPAWSPASYRSETTRLTKYFDYIDGDAVKLWEALKTLKPYTRATYWTRVSAFWDWAIDERRIEGPNPYKKFRKKHPQCFRNVYVRRPPKEGFAETMAKIMGADVPEDIRNRWIMLLTGGLRWSESHTLKDGRVIGKGNKEREVFPIVPEGPIADRSRYSTSLLELRKLGLWHHKLRGIFANEVVRRAKEYGLELYEIMELMGWSNAATGQSYIRANKDRIKRAVADIHRDAA